MSGVNKQRGFTIIEVTLFLAISSLLLATLVFGMQRMISQIRFSDSANSLTAYVQSQYEEVRSGVNVRDVGDIGAECAAATNSAPGTSNCLLIGKVIHFNYDSSNVVTSYVIATKTAASTLSDHAALEQSGLKAVSTGQETYEIQWSAKFTLGRVYQTPYSGPGSYGDVDTLAILRSPVSSQVMVYTYKNNDAKSLTDLIRDNGSGAGGGFGTLNQPSVFVIKNAEISGLKTAGVCVDPGSISGAVHPVIPIDTTNDTTLRTACEK